MSKLLQKAVAAEYSEVTRSPSWKLRKSDIRWKRTVSEYHSNLYKLAYARRRLVHELYQDIIRPIAEISGYNKVYLDIGNFPGINVRKYIFLEGKKLPKTFVPFDGSSKPSVGRYLNDYSYKLSPNMPLRIFLARDDKENKKSRWEPPIQMRWRKGMLEISNPVTEFLNRPGAFAIRPTSKSPVKTILEIIKTYQRGKAKYLDKLQRELKIKSGVKHATVTYSIYGKDDPDIVYNTYRHP